MEPALEWRDGHIVAIDQTILPQELRMLHITTVDELIEAIGSLAIRGAPALGVAGALGVALAVRQGARSGWSSDRLAAEVNRLAEARPTAVNLRREVNAAFAARDPEAFAVARLEQTVAETLAISQNGAEFLRSACDAPSLRVHTHCNTGGLACLGWGTALGVIRALHTDGALNHVLVGETRPLLQGARLTCWELDELGIEHYLVTDGAGPFMISRGLADAVVVGADRVAANGDVANKIGTFSLALAAREAGIPFVVAAPESTLDPATPSGADIPLEQRPAAEVAAIGAPTGTLAVNYAFDITPASLVAAVVTEERVIINAPG